MRRAVRSEIAQGVMFVVLLLALLAAGAIADGYINGSLP